MTPPPWGQKSLWLCLVDLVEEVLQDKKGKLQSRGAGQETHRGPRTVWFGRTSGHRSRLASGRPGARCRPAVVGPWLRPFPAFRCTCKGQTSTALPTSTSSKGTSGLCQCPFSLGRLALGGHCCLASERQPWHFLSAASFSSDSQESQRGAR